MIDFSDIENELNPSGSATKFKSSNYTVAVERAINNATAMVKGNLPEKYRRLITLHSGIVLTNSSQSGDFEFPLPPGFGYISGVVWINYTGLWKDRNSQEFVPVTVSGDMAVMPDPLSSGDSVVGDFVPGSGSTPQIIKSFALKLACNELRRTIPALVADADRQSLDNDLIFLRQDLKDLRRSDLRIDEWDSLSGLLIQELQTVTPLQCRVVEYGGW